MKKRLAILLLFNTALAAQCPSISQVLSNHQFRTPAGWQTLPLSPLANDTGKQTFTTQGLTHVFYLQKTHTLRCTYIKPGVGVAENTYVIKKTVKPFQIGKGHWQHIINNTVWACAATKPADCQWHDSV